MSRPRRKKSLLIGINYVGTRNQLRGCHQDVSNVAEFLSYRGYSSRAGDQVILRDDGRGGAAYVPTGHNILAAMSWLVSEPNTTCFLHYSGHGGQVRDPDGDRGSGFDDTIVPVDFEQHGQLDSDLLHKTLISPLAQGSTLFIIFDCCHSGSAVELPFVYRSDADGRVNLVDDVKQGVHLLAQANELIRGGFSMGKINEAKQLMAGATSFFNSLKHIGDAPQPAGLGEEHFAEDWKSEHKWATMFSGCRDDQTSADASIAGANVGAMSWAFLECMKAIPNATYLSTLQWTRQKLGQSHYQQVPQLSVGVQFDLDQPLIM